MEAQLQSQSQLPSIVISRLQTLASEIGQLITSLKDGKLQPTDHEFMLLGEVSLKISSEAPKVHGEVQALQKRRTEAVYKQGRDHLSSLDATHAYLKTGAKLKHRAAFVKSIQLLFNGPNVSKFDSTAIQARKRLNIDRCERIRRLGPSGAIWWAATFAPSQWDANAMSKPVFDFVLEFFNFDSRLLWTREIIDILKGLGEEAPLKDSSDYGHFLDGMSKSAANYSSAAQLPSQIRSHYKPNDERPSKRPRVMDEDESQSPSKESREMKHIYTNAPASNISKLPEPFKTAVQNSRLWKWERSKNMETTGCWPSLFPKDNRQDVSFTIWCGNDDGYRLNDIFGLELAISS